MGKRGPQPGAVYKPTKEKAIAREAHRAVIERHFERMTMAQIESSCGLAHLMLRDDLGRWSKAPETMTEDQMLEVLNGDQNRYMIALKDPNTQAFNTLAAYYLDKPKEQVQEIEISGEADLVAALMGGRQRAAKAKEGK